MISQECIERDGVMDFMEGISGGLEFDNNSAVIGMKLLYVIKVSLDCS